TDQYLHPRALATAIILGAILAVLDGRQLLAGALLTAAFFMHAIMAAFGASFCMFLFWHPAKRTETERGRAAVWTLPLLPLRWVFEPASDAWRQAAATRPFYFVLRWHWYEWLGVVAPLALLWWFRVLAERRRSAGAVHEVIALVSGRLVYFGVFQLAVALVMLLPARLERLRP